MTSIGTFSRMVGAAILLIAVQFASVAAEAHAGHGHGADGHGLQEHGLQSHGTVADAAHSIFSDETAPASRAARTQPAIRAEATAQNAPGAAASSDGCVMGCCGTGMGCCGAALAAASPSLPPKACSSRIGFVPPVSVRGVDPQGLRKPPRFLA